MLAKKYKLTKEKDIAAVFSRGKYFRNNILLVKVLKNNLPYSRFGFSVGLKISKKAVQRNKIKRTLNEIIRVNLKRIVKGFDVMAIPQKNILDKEKNEIEQGIISLLKEKKQ